MYGDPKSSIFSRHRGRMIPTIIDVNVLSDVNGLLPAEEEDGNMQRSDVCVSLGL